MDDEDTHSLESLKKSRVKHLKKIARSLGKEVPSDIKDKDTLVQFVYNLLQESQNEETCIFRQLKIGVDLANPDRCDNPMKKMIWNFAKQMVNFNYIYGDVESKEVIIVDPAWDPEGMMQYCRNEGWTVTAAILTHYHVDHAGGAPPPPFNSFGIQVPGAVEVARAGIPVYIHAHDVDKLVEATGISRDALTIVEDGAEIEVGSKKIRCIHAPGHTRGSMILVADDEDFVISGDAIFPGSCGKLEDDWPQSCFCMYKSLMNLGKTLNPEYCIYPGHGYGPPTTTVRKEIANGFLKPCTWPEFAAKLGVSPPPEEEVVQSAEAEREDDLDALD